LCLGIRAYREVLSESNPDKRYELVCDAVLVVFVPGTQNTFIVKEPGH